jgi:hypothetical protein
MFKTLQRFLGNSSSCWLDFVFVAVLALVWYGWLLRVGIAISPDSAEYLFFSLQILKDFDFSGIYTVWPPAYPFLLAVVQLIDSSPTGAATLVSAISLLILLWALMQILVELYVPRYLRYLAVIFLISNPNFLHIFEFAWADGPFTAFYMLFILYLVRHYKSGDYRFFLMACVTIALMSLTKYIGYFSFIVLGGYAFLLALRAPSQYLTHFRLYVLPLGLSLAPSFAWVVRNYLVDGTLHGVRYPAQATLSQNLGYLLNITFRDNQPIILMAIGLVICFFLFFRQQIKGDEKRKKSLLLILASGLIYLSLLMYSVSTVDLEQLYTRYISPIYPLLILVVVYVITTMHQEIVLDNTKEKTRQIVLVFVIVSMSVTLLYTWRQHTRPYFSRPFHIVKYTDFTFFHGELGFNISKEKIVLSTWLERQLATNKQANLYVMINHRPNVTEPYLNRALVLRKHILPNYSVLSYDAQKDSVTLNVKDQSGVGNSLRYIHLASSNQLNESFRWSSNTLAILDHERITELRPLLNQHHCTIEKISYLYGVKC